FIVVGAARGFVLAHRRRDPRALAVVLGGAVPLIAGAAASILRKYPILDYPRLVLWMLPPCFVLLCFAAEPALDRVLSMLHSQRFRSAISSTIYACCLLAVGFSFVLMARQRGSFEGNREMFETIARSWKRGDCLFVHGGLSEQFALYSRWMRWDPPCLYLGNTDWPCCPLERQSRATNPAAQTFHDDVASAIAKTHPKRLWLALPSGTAGTWSAGLRPLLDRLPDTLKPLGCQIEKTQEYGDVTLKAVRCLYPN